ncbi:MAG: lasso RiPP family leader peptide-containing protein [Rhizobacter sp.]|nr:lasso RiPP family leader peptide-containing protein [Rhizobacter sp.]
MEKDLETPEVIELGDAKALTQGHNFPLLGEENPDYIYRE